MKAGTWRMPPAASSKAARAATADTRSYALRPARRRVASPTTRPAAASQKNRYIPAKPGGCHSAIMLACDRVSDTAISRQLAIPSGVTSVAPRPTSRDDRALAQPLSLEQ